MQRTAIVPIQTVTAFTAREFMCSLATLESFNNQNNN